MSRAYVEGSDGGSPSRRQRRVDGGILAALRAQQADDVGIGPRPAEQKTLTLMATLVAQAAQFGFGLDAFRRDRDAEALAEADDRTHDRLRVTVGAEIAHERLVDLCRMESSADSSGWNIPRECLLIEVDRK